MRQTSAAAAMREPSSGRGLLMWERLAMAAYCNCPLVQSSIKCQQLPVQHCCRVWNGICIACINYAKWSWNRNCMTCKNCTNCLSPDPPDCARTILGTISAWADSAWQLDSSMPLLPLLAPAPAPVKIGTYCHQISMWILPPIRVHCLVYYRWNSLDVAILRGFASLCNCCWCHWCNSCWLSVALVDCINIVINRHCPPLPPIA